MSTFKIARSFILPFTVLVAVPWAIHSWLEPLQTRNVFSIALGAVFILSGLAMLAWTNVLFVAFGNGTLAPWDPTEKLGLLGPYSYVRNPMILGVVVAILGEALLFSSFWLLGWSGLFAMINHLWFVRWEEPALAKRYGKDYERYAQNVPRWIPNFKPYDHA